MRPKNKNWYSPDLIIGFRFYVFIFFVMLIAIGLGFLRILVHQYWLGTIAKCIFAFGLLVGIAGSYDPFRLNLIIVSIIRILKKHKISK